MRINIVVSMVFLCFTANVANAELKTTSPTDVCSFMKENGMATTGWKNYYENDFGCSSPYKDLGYGYPLANNLAFYVDGNAKTVDQVYLMLNINNKALATNAHEELLKASELMCVKATGYNLPQALKTAIINGQNASDKIGDAFAEISRKDWPTGKGYEVKVLIK